jgi:hypothetical protein
LRAHCPSQRSVSSIWRTDSEQGSHLGEPVVRVQLLPQRGGRHSPRKAVDDHQLLADVQAALQQLRLDALQLDVAFEQRLQARRILLPQALP